MIFIPLRQCRWCWVRVSGWMLYMWILEVSRHEATTKNTFHFFFTLCVKCILCIMLCIYIYCIKLFTYHIHAFDIMIHILYTYIYTCIVYTHRSFPCEKRYLPSLAPLRVVHECRPSTRPMQGTLPLEAHVLLFREDMILGLHRRPNKNMGKSDPGKIHISLQLPILFGTRHPAVWLFFEELGGYFRFCSWLNLLRFFSHLLTGCAAKVSTATSAANNSITDELRMKNGEPPLWVEHLEVCQLFQKIATTYYCWLRFQVFHQPCF